MGIYKSRKALAIVILVVLIYFLSSSAFPVTTRAENNKGEKQVVAIVNGENITKKELSERASIYRIFMALRSVPLFAEFLMETDQGEASMDRYRSFVLDKLIREKIILQKAESSGISVTEEEINKRLDVIIKKTKEVDSKQELMERLQKDRRTLHDLKEEISYKLLREKLKKKVLGSVKVSEREIKNYYSNNRDSFRDNAGTIRPLSEVKDHIREALRRDKKDQLWKEWLNQSRDEATIVKKMDS